MDADGTQLVPSTGQPVRVLPHERTAPPHSYSGNPRQLSQDEEAIAQRGDVQPRGNAQPTTIEQVSASMIQQLENACEELHRWNDVITELGDFVEPTRPPAGTPETIITENGQLQSSSHRPRTRRERITARLAPVTEDPDQLEAEAARRRTTPAIVGDRNFRNGQPVDQDLPLPLRRVPVEPGPPLVCPEPSPMPFIIQPLTHRNLYDMTKFIPQSGDIQPTCLTVWLARLTNSQQPRLRSTAPNTLNMDEITSRVLALMLSPVGTIHERMPTHTSPGGKSTAHADTS